MSKRLPGGVCVDCKKKYTRLAADGRCTRCRHKGFQDAVRRGNPTLAAECARIALMEPLYSNDHAAGAERERAALAALSVVPERINPLAAEAYLDMGASGLKHKRGGPNSGRSGEV